ncbi:TetR family transcriptional regulator [Nonomuraea phyllanthi]|uniref:TetR family transcriptional regulator n=1 Tax=Nonomuraea phyllanthi TaxID=2219224 RepID=A0A5C4WLY7_9ACTN|nr:helix-turn-helix domain-containing protein [Nonomuraea phyllanthi]KAB8194628.1 TetR family transcriptional regulator [Nonomuraea phyllanthi]
MSGLRERWRLKAMRTIQERALDLFDEKGFTAVTIEEIAAAAEVSPSSVYRFFGTKEGIVVADVEFDSMSPEALKDVLDPGDPVGSLLRAVRAYESGPEPASGSGDPDGSGGPDGSGNPDGSGGPDGSGAGRSRTERSPWRRVRYFFAEPSVRTAVCGTLDRAGQRIAPLIAASGGLTETQARVLANALAFGYFAALEQWYLDGGDRPIAGYVEEGMRPLRGIWPSPGQEPPGPGAG